MELKLATTTEELKATNESLEAKVSDPKLKDQERQISELAAKIRILEEEKSHLKGLLDEAAVDFQSEKEENEHLAQTVTALQVLRAQQCAISLMNLAISALSLHFNEF